MSFYSDLQATADNLLKQFGQQVIITRQVGDASAYDPTLGTVPVGQTTQTGFGAVFGQDDKNVNGTTILQGDKKLMLSAAGITSPRPDDLVLVGSDTYSITTVNSLDPAGVVVMFECNLRGASQ